MFIKLIRQVGLALFAVTLAYTQGVTTLTVNVRDPQGATVPNAQVDVYPQGSVSAIHAQATDQGRYRVSLQAGGTYVLHVEAVGFRNVSKPTTVPENASESATESIELELAGINSTVVVTAADAVQTVDQI